MKKRILALVLAALMIVPMALTLFAAEPAQNYSKISWKNEIAKLATMELMGTSPDGNMLLYVDKTSGEMGIKNVATGKIVLSNPYDIGSSGLLNREKPYALSQIDLNFTTISSGEAKTFHSYSDCFMSGQAKITKLENGNGIRVDYIIGNQEQRLLVPNKISMKDMEALLESGKVKIAADKELELREEYKTELENGSITEEYIISEAEKQADTYYRAIRTQLIQNYYKPLYGQSTQGVDLSTLKVKNDDGTEEYLFPEIVQEEWAKSNYYIPQAHAEQSAKEYPICMEIPIYVIQNPGSINQPVEDYIKKYTDYDFDRLDADYAKVEEKGIDDFSTEDRPKFELTATYEVTNNGLVATVDASTLKYDTTKYIVNTISVLPYFNSAHASKTEAGQTYCDKGYTFIPDGSGALVRFEDLYEDNNKQVKFENTMYGNDYAYYQVATKNAANMTMPVFGLSNHTDKNGFVAVIEDGDAMAIITSNHSTAYHSIYSTFKITPTDVYDLADSFSGGTSSSKKIGITADRIYNGKCQVNYMLLTDDEVALEYGITDYYENTYVGMAECYRNYLQERGLIKKISDERINKDYVKLFLEAFGSVKVEEKIATFPVTVDKALTTFEDIKTIYNELYAPLDEEGKLIESDVIGNISFILKGFNNGGLISDYPTYIKWQEVLGGEKGFNDLLSFAEQNGFDVAPNIEFSYSYKSGRFSEYSHSEHGVRTLDNRYTTKRNYYAATQTFERTGGVAVSSASFEYLYDLFYADMSKYNVKWLSVRSLGSDLNSDFDDDDYHLRQSSKDNVVAMLKLLNGESGNKQYNLIIDAGNSYAMPYADAVLSVSLDSSRRSEMSESVPFFGIVYHGSVEFAGDAFNMEGDTEYALLKAIENGASLYFTIAKQNVELLKFEPEYNQYYSVSYDNLKSTIVETYKVYNEAMKDVQNKYIVNHCFLDATRTEDGTYVDSSLVVMVEYEGGICFVLNYSTDEIEVNMPNGETRVIKAFGFEKCNK
ncbi:MAG: hypothetical protein J6B45_02420 [Clostridia bacterium]|nr:hypothetical protein [Clostridia bacterium]